MGDNPLPREATVNIADDKNKGIRDYATPEFGQLAEGIGRPKMTATTFEPKPVMFQMIFAMGQFGGLSSEDPHSHLKSFIEMMDHFKIPGVTQEALLLMFFLYTLNDRARAWLNSQPPNSILTWNDLAENFLKKYFPPTRNVKIRNDIMTIRQEEDEAVSDAWERFKDLLRKCPHHGVPHCIQLETFYNGLSNSAKTILNATAGGAFTAKTYNEGHDILERISNNNTEWSNPRAVVSKSALGIHEIDIISALNAQIVALTNLIKNNLRLNGEINQVQSMMSNPPMTESCVFCGESHSYEYCYGNPVSMNYVGSHVRNSPFSPAYNSNWRNHPNFSWIGNSGLQPPGVTQVQNRPQNPSGYGQGFINQTNATLKRFETQLGQFAADLKDRSLGTLPSDTETPKGKEHIKVVTVLSEESSKVNNDTSETVEKSTHQNKVSHAFDMPNFPILSPPNEETQKSVSVQKTVPASTSSNVQLSDRTSKPNRSIQSAPDLKNLPFPERMKNKNV
ncbi:uncharacterized protein LOC112505870 [Cynara cardunculus var. scolymus]|uniref:uncharacterized protein LOC112505870 n=1 Tax=Cynara cardunculus var. scolymus TaxID=59895 RepID=UPI000D62FD05|nr:uncharacterized protein LOC112505870 [Cynara cardunculus var. scolymus]